MILSNDKEGLNISKLETKISIGTTFLRDLVEPLPDDPFGAQGEWSWEPVEKVGLSFRYFCPATGAEGGED